MLFKFECNFEATSKRGTAMGTLIKIWKTIPMPDGATVGRNGAVTWTVRGKKRTGKLSTSPGRVTIQSDTWTAQFMDETGKTQRISTKTTVRSVAEKNSYKVINWAEYNQALVNRGNFTFWVSDAVIQQWHHENVAFKVGRPFTYSDLAIETLLTLRELYRLTYRSTEGFAKGLMGLMKIQVLVPDFTTVAKRAKTLSVALSASKVKGAVCLVVDSTGLKVYGEGEWKVRKYGSCDNRE